MTEYIRKQDAFDAVEARIAELMTHPEFRRKHLDIDLSGVIRNISAIKPADVARVIHCRNCKYFRIHRCIDSMPIEICDLDQTFYDPDRDFCSLAESREGN